MKKVVSLACASLVACTLPIQAEEVNIYSYRQPHLIEPMLKAFTEETGIATNVVFAKKGVAERLKREGQNSPADVILTVDIGRLLELVEGDLVQPVSSDTIDGNIPESFRDPDGLWFGLTLRARNIYASKDRNVRTDLDYEDLAKPEFKGKVCTRSGKHPYNVALISSLVAHLGEAETEKWLEGVKANLARKPQGNDRGQVKAVSEGLCDVSIGNSYYYGKMWNEPEQRPWAEAVNIVFPNQDNRGTHVNVSGMVMAKYSPNKESAMTLMEFLTGDKAQQMYAEDNFEYPVKPGVEPSELVKSWGDFKMDEIPLAETAKHRATAVKLVDKVDFDG